MVRFNERQRSETRSQKPDLTCNKRLRFDDKGTANRRDFDGDKACGGCHDRLSVNESLGFEPVKDESRATRAELHRGVPQSCSSHGRFPRRTAMGQRRTHAAATRHGQMPAGDPGSLHDSSIFLSQFAERCSGRPSTSASGAQSRGGHCAASPAGAAFTGATSRRFCRLGLSSRAEKPGGTTVGIRSPEPAGG